MRNAMRVALAALGVTLLPGALAAGSLDLRLGGFVPAADSNLFDDDAELYTVGDDDWPGFSGGLEYRFKLSGPLQMGLHLDAYDRTVHTSYRDFVRENGREIRQSLHLSIVPVGISLRLAPQDRDRRLVPYLAAGVDAVFWRYEEEGSFIDFFVPGLPVTDDFVFVSEGVAPGFHVVGGLNVRLNDDVSLSGEARYLVGEADMGEDFRGNKLDLSGIQATVGVSIRF